MKAEKNVAVNVNRMKKCYTIPRRGKARKETAPADKTKHSDN
jgi:hypothetical protein